MTTVSIRDLEKLFMKYYKLRKHLISPTKDFLDELWNWKVKFVKFVVNSQQIPYEVKCKLLGEPSILEEKR